MVDAGLPKNAEFGDGTDYDGYTEPLGIQAITSEWVVRTNYIKKLLNEWI